MTIQQPAPSSAPRFAGSARPVPPPAPRIGGELKAARERLGWSLRDTSDYVRIRLPLLEALEDGRIGALPGPAYALGFVRTYALALGMDAEEAVRRARDELGPTLPRAELKFPAPLPQRHVPPGAVVLLGAALAVLGYAGWYRGSLDRPTTVAVQQVPARLAPLALPPVPAPPPHVASATPAPTATIASIPPRSVSPSAAEASTPAPGSLLPVNTPPLAAAPTPTAAAALVLNATADAWVQVKDGQGKVVMSRLMHAGDSWPVPDQPQGAAPLQLTTGNAGGTELTLGGEKLPALGASGAVLRDVVLEPDSLRGRAGKG